MLTHTQVEAHKVILAASGPFFHAILKKNKHPHPLVFMRGVKLEGLVNLVCSESGTQTFVESETIESEIEERCTGALKWPKTAPKRPRMSQNPQNGSKWHCMTPIL